MIAASALPDIAPLWLVLAATVVAFFRKAPVAGLLLPYGLWVSSAAYLNDAI